MQIDWGPQYIVSVDTEDPNLSCRVSGFSKPIVTNFSGFVEKAARIDSGMPLYIALSPSATIADIDRLNAIVTAAGIEKHRTLLENPPKATAEWEPTPYREIRISPPRSIYGHLYEWYLERKRDEVQQGGPGYPPQSVGSPDP